MLQSVATFVQKVYSNKANLYKVLKDEMNIFARAYLVNVCKLTEPQTFTDYYRSVDPSIQMWVDEYKKIEDKARSLGAWLLASYGLRQAGVESLTLAKSSSGKPYLRGNSKTNFNISHSKDYAMCALSNVEVGCDIEHASEPSLSIASKFFSEREKTILFDKPLEDLGKCFYTLWTLKESYAKMTGDGIDESFSKTFIDTCKTHQIINGQMCSLYTNSWGEDYIFSMCLKGVLDVSNISIEQIDIGELCTCNCQL